MNFKYSSATRQVWFWFLLDSFLILLVLFSLLLVSPPPQPESSGRVSWGRPQALCWVEPQVHLSLPFMCSTEALSLFVDHSMVAAAWQKDWRAHGGRNPRGLAVTLLPILPTERLGGKVREERCRLDWNRNVWSRLRKIQNIRLWVPATLTEFRLQCFILYSANFSQSWRNLSTLLSFSAKTTGQLID